MKPTVDEVVKGLVTQGYRVTGGSDVWRSLYKGRITIKVYYNDYDKRERIIIRES